MSLCCDLIDIMPASGACPQASPGIEQTVKAICREDVLAVPDADPLLPCTITSNITQAVGAMFSSFGVELDAEVVSNREYQGNWITTIKMTVTGFNAAVLCAVAALTSSEVVVYFTTKAGQSFLLGDEKTGVRFKSESTTAQSGSNGKSQTVLTGELTSAHTPYEYNGIII